MLGVLCGSASKTGISGMYGRVPDVGVGGKLTAPYLDICRTNSAASLNRGRGTMVLALGQERAALSEGVGGFVNVRVFLRIAVALVVRFSIARFS